MKRAAAVLPFLLLTACGTWPRGSYVQAVSPADAKVLAPAIADYLYVALPAGSAVTMVPAGANDPIHVALTPDLDRLRITQAAAGLPVRYVATPLDSGLMLRISVADREGASRYFARGSNGAISPAGPLTVMQP